MSDLSEDFKALKELRNERKAQRYLESSAARSEICKIALNIEYKNNGEHWIVRTEKETIDFWQSTGRWIVRGKKSQGYDARSLLKRIKHEQR